VLLARAGWSIRPLASYEAHGGYDALRKAMEIGERVVDEVVRSGLVGRGGAAFPTGRKWQAVAGHASTPHYLVANADESEPGTFRDRVLIENDPFSLVEAMTVAAFATGCDKGYVYMRGEYPIAWRRLGDAIDAARAAGYLGDDILGRGVRFDIEMRKGAGAYICGEETALFNSIEGYRGEPRSKPPFPVDVGLFGQPTVANNVETLVNVLPIVLDGGDAFARTGAGMSTGTKLFCVSGHVGRPGVYEVPFGPTLADVIELAGGVGGSGRLQAILLGGVAGRFVGPEALDTPLTFEGARSIGASLGSGVILPLDDTVDLRPLLVRVAGFFRHESCGQCVPCRVGTVRQQEALVRLTKGSDVNRELALIDEVGRCMRDASICGQPTATTPPTAWGGSKSRMPPDVEVDGPRHRREWRDLLALAAPGPCVPTLWAADASRRTRAASASSSSTAAACSRRLAHARPKTAWSCTPKLTARSTPASSCSSCSRRPPSSIGHPTSRRGSMSTAPLPHDSVTTPRPSINPRRSTTNHATTADASSATVRRRVGGSGRTRSPSQSPSRLRRTSHPSVVASPTPPACTAATASPCAQPAR
jgi:NADH:ubiquinone oxidoreductase subunit F (NADH-binding)